MRRTPERRPQPRSPWRRCVRAGALGVLLLLAGLYSAPPRARAEGAQPSAPTFFPDWSGVPTPYYPLSPDTVRNPVLTGADVTDCNPNYVADPFLFHEGSTWYLFFEVFCTYGRIGLAESPDGVHWTYDRIVLDVQHHLSYPYVFKYGSSYFMTPESGYSNAVNLYEATSFPYSWQLVGPLVQGQAFADPVIINHGGIWYLFVSSSDSRTLYLFYSHNLVTGWTPHPQSPIVQDLGKARPAGRFITYDTDHLIRVAQKCDVTYGQGVRAFQVDTLTTTRYAEHEIPESPILMASGQGWNKDGMHQCDPWWDGDRWVVSVDGLGGFDWSIGIYLSAPPPNSSTPPASSSTGRARAVTVAPNPFSGGVSLQDSRPASDSPEEGAWRIFDPFGRTIRWLRPPAGLPGPHHVWWDGRDEAGREVPPGVYYCRVGDGRGAAEGTLIRLR